MRLENFELSAPFGCIELVGLGHRWDLHSWADFVGITFTPEKDELSFEWRVPSGEQNPWGSPGNQARGCRLRFIGVQHVMVTPRDSAFPKEDASSVDSIGKAIPGEREYRYKSSWAPSEPFFLRFEFVDGRAIEVGSDAVSLEAIK